MARARYEIGWHASEDQVCHIAYIDENLDRNEIVDVTLYDRDVIEENGRTAYANSLEALELLVSRANAGLESE